MHILSPAECLKYRICSKTVFFVHTVKCFNESLSMDSVHLFTLMARLHGANFVLVSRFFLLKR